MMISVAQPTTINRRSGCVKMALHANAVDQYGHAVSLPSSPSVSLQIDSDLAIEVSLTIDFRGEQTIAIPAGKRLGLENGEVTFGFRRGRLQLLLENCTLPRTDAGLGQGNRRLAPREVRAEEIYVERQGSEESPAWMFEVQGRQRLLEGKLTHALLGTLHHLSNPCSLTARFMVESEDIRLDLGECHSIPRNKLAVIQRILTHEYIKPQMDAVPISETSWQYE